MDSRQIPTFDHLRRLKSELEHDIYNRTRYTDTAYAKESADRWQEALSRQEENKLDQGIVDEINFVLDFFRPPVSQWPRWAYFTLGAVATTVLVLAALALANMV